MNKKFGRPEGMTDLGLYLPDFCFADMWIEIGRAMVATNKLINGGE